MTLNQLITSLDHWPPGWLADWQQREHGIRHVEMWLTRNEEKYNFIHTMRGKIQKTKMRSTVASPSMNNESATSGRSRCLNSAAFEPFSSMSKWFSCWRMVSRKLAPRCSGFLEPSMRFSSPQRSPRELTITARPRDSNRGLMCNTINESVEIRLPCWRFTENL